MFQVQSRLQAEGVARTQAGVLHARGKRRIPQRDGTVLGQHDLEAVLAGVAGAGDEQRRAVDRLRFDGGELAELADAGAVVLRDQADDLVASNRPLRSEERRVGKGWVSPWRFRWSTAYLYKYRSNTNDSVSTLPTNA